MTDELSEDEIGRFELLRGAEAVVLVRGTFEGREVAYVAMQTPLEESDDVLLWPIAMLLPDWLHDRMRGPEGDVVDE